MSLDQSWRLAPSRDRLGCRSQAILEFATGHLDQNTLPNVPHHSSQSFRRQLHAPDGQRIGLGIAVSEG
jgi:hypothetical protein